jgi:hypothetical protein
MEWTIIKTDEESFIRLMPRRNFNHVDYRAMVNDVVTSDFWESGTDVLVDYRQVEFGASNIETFRELVCIHQKYDTQIGTCRLAILMKTQADFGRGRQFELLARGKIAASLHIFLEEQEAVHWLLDRLNI